MYSMNASYLSYTYVFLWLYVLAGSVEEVSRVRIEKPVSFGLSSTMIVEDLKKNSLRILGLILYILLSAVVFMKIEQKDELNIVVAKRLLQDVKNNLSLLGANVTEQEFLDLIKNITEALLTKERPDWEYWKSVDFVIQSLTTIGYGWMTPRTETGQTVFIFFALIGLPFTMVTLKSTGELMKAVIKKIIVLFEKHLLQRQETKNLCIKCFVVSVIQFITIHLYSAYLFKIFNKTSFLEGIYASFVAFSTIGFGDYTLDVEKMGERSNNAPSLTTIVVLNFPLLLANLTIVSCFLNSLMDIIEMFRHNKTEVRNMTECHDNPIAMNSGC